MRLPDSGSEAFRWLFIAGAVALVAILGYYAFNAMLTIGVMLGLWIVAGIVVLVVGGRVWDVFRHGKPLFRGDWRDGGGEGGD